MKRWRLITIVVSMAAALIGIVLSSQAISLKKWTIEDNARVSKAISARAYELRRLRSIERATPPIRRAFLATKAQNSVVAADLDSRQLAAFHAAFTPSHDAAYAEAYKAKFPIAIGDGDWYVVRAKASPTYHTNSWVAPAGQEYVVNSGTVTSYARGTAPDPYSYVWNGTGSSSDSGTGSYASPGDVPGYYNSQGDWVPSPSSDPNLEPGGPTAVCGDGSYSYSESASGTCSWHGGVSEWLSHP